MARANYLIDNELFQYMQSIAVHEPAPLVRVREKTKQMRGWGKMLTPESAQLIRFLQRLVGAKRCLDIGTFTGYSAISMALSLPEGGVVHTCDNNSKHLDIAKNFFHEAGVSGKIIVHLGNALDSMDYIISELGEHQFDMIFIDADKHNNEQYYQKSLRQLRPGGIIIVDNIFWYKQVLDQECQDGDTQSVREFNMRRSVLAEDCMSVVPLGDGLMLICPDIKMPENMVA